MIEYFLEYLAADCVENGSDEQCGGESVSFGGEEGEERE